MAAAPSMIVLFQYDLGRHLLIDALRRKNKMSQKMAAPTVLPFEPVA
jgi:hypothetical protein